MFKDKKIFILGMARSGYEAALVLAKNNTVLITDRKEQELSKVSELEKNNVTVIITEDPINLLDESYDYVVKNPGIKLDHPVAFLNLDNGKESKLDTWHWVTIVGIEYNKNEELYATIADEGLLKTIDLSLWINSTSKEGGFIYFK